MAEAIDRSNCYREAGADPTARQTLAFRPGMDSAGGARLNAPCGSAWAV
jgi:hypothetical protein